MGSTQASRERGFGSGVSKPRWRLYELDARELDDIDASVDASAQNGFGWLE